MKASAAFFSVMLIVQSAIGQLNVTFRSQMPFPGIASSNIWGYVDSLGNEYALVGTSDGVRIIDVTNPVLPVQRFAVAGNTSNWREIKTYGKYAFVTTEATAPNPGIQIINLSNLPTSISTRYWRGTGAINNLLNKAHALHIDAGYLYLYGTNLYGGAPLIINLLPDPWNPVYVGTCNYPSSPYVHDGFVRNDTLFAGHIYAGVFNVWNVTNKTSPVLIATQPTPGAFTHNTWLTDNSRILLTTDEVSNSFLTSYDISDPLNITELDRIQSQFPLSGSIVHNTYVKNDFAVTSWYRDGITIVDASRRGNLITTGYFDCNTTMSGNGFNSIWGVYPFLPSGNIVCSDIEQGLFVLSPTYVRACYLEGLITDSLTGVPLPNTLVEILATTTSELSKITGQYKTGTSAAGVYSVRFSKAGYYTKVITNVSLTNGNLTTLNVELVPITTINVNGNVKSSFTGLNISAANVKFENATYTFNTTTNASGNFTIAGFYPGTYDVTIGKWLYKNKCVTMNVTSASSPMTFVCDTGIYDDFSFNYGWTVSGTAPAGIWTRAVPLGTTYSTAGDANPASDAASDCSRLCYVTGNGGGTYSFDDVDNGSTIITSPVFNPLLYPNPQINYSRWFFNIPSSGPANDTLIISLTNGITTVLLEKVVASTPPGMSQWVNRSFVISSYITPTSTMQLIVYTADQVATGNALEAGFDFFSVSNFSPLPVELISFNALALENHNLLTWTTGSEVNNDRFEIERSDNGSSFTKIGVVNGAGNSTTTLVYQYEDPEIEQGTIYYRLRQVDFDGVNSLSDVVALKREQHSTHFVITYPNPVSDILSITFTQKNDHATLAEIFDIYGKKMMEKTIPSGIITENVDLKHLSLSPGLYQVRITDRSNNYHAKFLKK
jgi:choice-of-anchor B domain-containing protein